MPSLSILSEKQKAAFISLSLFKAKAPAKIKKLIQEQSFGKVYDTMSNLQDLPFSVQDFIDVGMMATGLQNAHMFLLAVEAKNDAGAIESLANSLDTHCWGQIADQINAKLPDESRHFSGSDLHYAHAPAETGACSLGGSAIGSALAPVIGAGMAVSGFFAGTLPDFFENDFKDFFVDDVAGVFTNEVAGFFGTIADGFLDGTGEVADFFKDDVGGAFSDAGNAIKDAAGTVGGWFGSLGGLFG